MKLTQKTLNNIKYVSMKDYLKNVESYESIEDKMKYTTRYLLSHGGHEDFSLEEAIQIARYNISKDLVKEENKDNLKANMFISNPVQYIKNEATKLSLALDNNPNNKNYNLLSSSQYIANYLNEEDMERNLNRVTENKSFGVRYNLINKMGGRKELAENYNKTKPGFFARLFNTTSNEWKSLDKIYKDFNNPGNENYGNKEALKNAAIAYLKHKFPSYVEGDKYLDSNSRIAILKGETVAAKTKFALNIIASVNEQKQSDKSFSLALEEAKNKNVTYDDIQNENKLDTLEQDDFQKDLDDSIEDNFLEEKDIDKESLGRQRLEMFKKLGSIENVFKEANKLEQNELVKEMEPSK